MALQQDADVILLDGIGNEREAGLFVCAVRRGQFVILAEKEDSVTAALLHLVQCGGSTRFADPSGKSGAGTGGGYGAEAAAAAG